MSAGLALATGGGAMSVEQARRRYQHVAAVMRLHGESVGARRHACSTCSWMCRVADATSIALDLAVATSVATATHERRREVIWEDRLHRTLLAEVAF